MRATNLVIAVLALASAGCTSLDFSPRNTAKQEAGMGEYFAVRLEAGREYLKQGNITKAIEAFRQASYNPATAPEALNGMGVAYSMLGRNDVARGLFERAIEQDPVDQRYWRNLARVDEQIMLAKAAPSAGGGSGIVPAAGSPSPTMAETTSAAQPASVRRVQAATLRTARARETFITTAVGDAGTSVSSPLSVTRRMAARPAGITVEGRPGSARYPVRIELSSPKKPAVALRRSGDRKAYPIRVALDAQ